MKIAIDVSPLTSHHAYRGIGVYTDELTKALQKLNTNHEIVLKSNTSTKVYDLIHYPYFDFFFLTLPNNKSTPVVVTVHDAIPLRYPLHYPRGLRGSIKFLIQKKRLSKADAIITDSEASKQDIGRWLYPDTSKIERIYLAAPGGMIRQPESGVRKVKKKYGITEQYLLYVGDINYNKNLPALIEAYAQAHLPAQLVLVSKAFAHDIPEADGLRNQIKRLSLEKEVVLLSEVASKEELAGLYSGAYWYIQPSLYEGFGLPVLEAWSCNVPVISSNGGSLREVVQDAALLFDPNNILSMVSTIQKGSLFNKTEREVWIRKGTNRLKAFSWEKTATQTLAVYEKVLS
jgi:glycosyltransferase involved in cell wall biosynthesis